jgi:hypothetical protein
MAGSTHLRQQRGLLENSPILPEDAGPPCALFLRLRAKWPACFHRGIVTKEIAEALVQ